MRRLFSNFGYKLLALTIALFLWAVAHGTSPIERGIDIPVVLRGVPKDLVVTDRSVDAVNVRVRGTRAALGNLSPAELEYEMDVSGVKPGVADFEVDTSGVEEKLPRGGRIVSRSPAVIQLTFEPRASRAVRVRPDVSGEPAAGFVVAGVDVQPSRVQISGARSEVLRLSEVVTETIDVNGAQEPLEREVRVSLGGGHLWLEEARPVRVRVRIEPEATAAPEPQAG